jgi:transcriptional regulator with XRE-family HTH domain
MSTLLSGNFSLDKFGEKLRILRVSLPGSPSIEDFAKKIGVSKASLSRYEAGQSEPPVSLLGPLVREIGPEAIELIPEAAVSVRDRVTGVLPEHVQEAYKVVREALDVAKADISTMDQDRIGLVIGLAAEEIARGNRAEARQTLLRRAEVLLGLKAP